MLGKANKYAEICFKGGFIGADYDMDIDLTSKLPDNWREFNKIFIPIYLEKHPRKSKIAAGLSCGMLYTVSKGMQNGDIVLCQNGLGSYYVGKIIDGYSYKPGEILQHRRKVEWEELRIDKMDMTESLRNSAGSIGLVSNITKYSDEIEQLIFGKSSPRFLLNDDTIEDPTAFALEKHLEDFLVHNWSQTALGSKYEIFEEDGELVGQQYPSDTGPIDILAISKDEKELLVVELKKGRASDHVVGQIQRYMGYVKQELAEEDQSVRGLIIALEDDIRIQRALSVASNIEFYKYQVSFKLLKVK